MNRYFIYNQNKEIEKKIQNDMLVSILPNQTKGEMHLKCIWKSTKTTSQMYSFIEKSRLLHSNIFT